MGLADVLRESISDHERHIALLNHHMKMFSTSINKSGWKIRRETPAGSICLFWAVCDKMEFLDSGEHHTQDGLRQETITM